MSEKKIDLIAQMLAKAESTTPEEAKALTEAAEKLMAKYLIDQSVIDERRAKEGKASEKIVEVRIDFTGAYRGEWLNLCSSVVWGLGTLRGMQLTTANKGKKFSFWLVGFESDVKQAEVLIRSLQIQATVAVREWWKENKSFWNAESTYIQEKKRRSFVHGFGDGVGMRMKENRNQAVKEAGTGTDLVLVSRKDKVDEFMSAKKLRRGRNRNATGGDMAAYDGIAKGRQAHTGERGMTQERGISA